MSYFVMFDLSGADSVGSVLLFLASALLQHFKKFYEKPVIYCGFLSHIYSCYYNYELSSASSSGKVGRSPSSPAIINKELALSARSSKKENYYDYVY